MMIKDVKFEPIHTLSSKTRKTLIYKLNTKNKESINKVFITKVFT